MSVVQVNQKSMKDYLRIYSAVEENLQQGVDIGEGEIFKFEDLLYRLELDEELTTVRSIGALLLHGHTILEMGLKDTIALSVSFHTLGKLLERYDLLLPLPPEQL